MTASAGTTDAAHAGFRTGKEQLALNNRYGGPEPREQPEGNLQLALQDADLVVRPIVSLDAARELWNTFLQYRDVILSDPACYDEIAGKREMNRTGAHRLSLAFGLSVELIRVEEGPVHDPDGEGMDYRFRTVVRVSKGRRFADGIATCRVSEIADKTKKGDPVPYSQREHFASSKSFTRAAKRGISDLLGGTEAD
jgi:hypothetical protein